jgi:non-specific serine/threonine protein kinase
MHRILALDPTGRLRTVEPAVGDSFEVEEIDAALVAALEDSSAAGLILLAGESRTSQLSPPLVYWRGFAQRLLRAICQLGETKPRQWKEVPPPAEGELAQLINSAPPMRGLEYLSLAVLRELWSELATEVAERGGAHAAGPAAYLQSLNPLLHLLGKVTFHLAENKRDPDRPFAFLATFTHQLSSAAKLQHLPLGEALRMYASAGDRPKLEALLAPVRRAANESPLVRDMLEKKTLFAPQAWSVGQAYRLLSEATRIEDTGVVMRLPDWWSSKRPPRATVQVRLGGEPSSAVGFDALLDFDVNLALDGDPLTAAERDQLLKSTENLVLLRGKWVQVDHDKLQEALDHWKKVQQEMPDGMSFLQGMRLLSGVQMDGTDETAEQVTGWSRVTAGDWLQQTLERMRSPSGDQDCHPGRDLQATLRPYQAEGVRWLWFMTELGLGACLADDMGLGKTIQLIDLLLQFKRRAKSEAFPRQPSLLIAPASLLGNWRDELARFAPTLRSFIAHRSECSAEQLSAIAKDPAAELADVDLVITTYSLARREKWLSEMKWSLVVLDEAQAIKNAASSQTRSVKAIPAAGRIVLTGTPVENHLGDLWSIFDFCCPGLLGTAAQFKKYVKRLSDQQDGAAYGSLRQLVRPYILRRMKTDPLIAPDLPAKTEVRTDCGLTKQQAALYQSAVKELEERLETADGIARRGLVLAMLMQLKQICNHPAQYLRQETFDPAASGKFERLRLLCETIVERQEKALVFTQFQSLTEPLAGYLQTVFGEPGLVLHGGTPVKKRQELVKQFQQDSRLPFFVISLKAGGSGLNLTAASHVIHFDRWWNPAVENQATDRAFRIGQKRNVLVHKFVCRGTVEERIDAMIRDKSALADSILNEESETRLTELSNDELLRFVSLDISRAGLE